MKFDQVLNAKQLIVLRFASEGDQMNLSLPFYRRAVIHLTRLNLLVQDGPNVRLTLRGLAVLDEFAAVLKGYDHVRRCA
jgi:hypothetical protein